jgi:hypothetical protein
MAIVTRVNGLACTVGTLYSLNANAFLITVKVAAGTAVDLRAEDDAVDEAVEMIVKELNPLMFLVTNSAAGTIHVVFDKNINSASELQTRICNMGASVGVNGIDVTGSTVVAATTVTVA